MTILSHILACSFTPQIIPRCKSRQSVWNHHTRPVMEGFLHKHGQIAHYIYISQASRQFVPISRLIIAGKPNTNLFNVRSAERARYDLFTNQIFGMIKEPNLRFAKSVVVVFEQILQLEKRQ